jgi:aminomethyltransferase
LKDTPLYEIHLGLNARFTEFAGWRMPLQYSGVIEEHLRVRSSCGLFDVSHMGLIEISGEGALGLVQLVSTNDASRIGDLQCQYTILCRPDGTVIDDCIFYRFAEDRFVFCTNAENTAAVFEWFKARAFKGAEVRDLSDAYAILALQGPNSVEVLRPLLKTDPAAIRHFFFSTAESVGMASIAGVEAFISRTGYTGEDGFEIYLPMDRAAALWAAIMDSGSPFSILPAGLAARDTLRLEMGFPLGGHELTAETTPIEAGLKRFVSMDKGDFIGREALKAGIDTGTAKTLIGFELVGRGVAREGYDILSGGAVVGRVTSGTYSPSLKLSIGMGYVEGPVGAIEVLIRSTPVAARIVKTPFHKKKLKASA